MAMYGITISQSSLGDYPQIDHCLANKMGFPNNSSSVGFSCLFIGFKYLHIQTGKIPTLDGTVSSIVLGLTSHCPCDLVLEWKHQDGLWENFINAL